jgi:hypothetical protein
MLLMMMYMTVTPGSRLEHLIEVYIESYITIQMFKCLEFHLFFYPDVGIRIVGGRRSAVSGY